ncbi:phosphoribosyltransferase-like protein [Globomyces pollinis-pini]|nr:phosphoribosyltransferase-like protein [Globomyces pollinis-pini]
MRNICIFSGSSHPALTEKICKQLGIPMGKSTLNKFSNQETNVCLDETVRDVDVYIVQSSCGKVNDNFIELLIMISACRTSSARKITAVIPSFPYARHLESTPIDQNPEKPIKKVTVKNASSVSFSSDTKPSLDTDNVLTSPDGKSPGTPTGTPHLNPRKRFSSISTSQPNIAITDLTPPRPGPSVGKPNSYKRWTAHPGTLIANLLMCAGCDHVITMDLHDPEFQGFFDVPVDNLFSHPIIIKYIKDKFPNYQDAVIVSPDAGGAKRATLIADKLNMEFALIHKERQHHGPRGSEMMLVGDVAGKDCIIIDDMSDTSDTICSAAQVLVDKGATSVVAIITHGILSGMAIERIEKSPLREVIVSNTVPQKEHMEKCSKIKVMDVAIIFAEAIRRIHNGESVSFLQDAVPY